ncbi:MAG: hypothetical protein R3345_05595 [Fulvivirga sp.]|nr:hypothetical protein [Fulvivirga sp.]
MRPLFILVVAVIYCSSTVQSQDKKFIHEQRVKAAHIPAHIIDKMEPYIDKARNSRYYKDQAGQHAVYICDFKLFENHYRVAFTSEGEFHAITQQSLFQELPLRSQNNINNYLNRFDKFKIKNVKKRFAHNSLSGEQLFASIKNKRLAEPEKYELLAKVKTRQGWKVYKMIFKNTGQLESKREILCQPEGKFFY